MSTRRLGRTAPLSVALLVAAAGIALLSESPAGAAFPAPNGPIVYPCYLPEGNGDLCRLDPQTLAVRVIVDGSFPVHPRRVGVSPDGSLVAYAQVFGIFIRTIDGGLVSTAPLGRPGDGDVSFTRDGRSIVYQCWGSGLCRTPVGGGPRAPIPGTIDGDTLPEVSPDGARVAFVNQGTLYTIPLEGGVRTPLTGGLAAPQVSWAPDGSRIAFGAGEGLCPALGIATIPSRGGPVTCLPNGAGAAAPSFSPDGTQIFVALLNGHGAFIGSNGIGRREAGDLDAPWWNNWAPAAGGGNPRCSALAQQLERQTNPRAQAIIRRYLTAAGCPG